jgi:hypothetical protein
MPSQGRAPEDEMGPPLLGTHASYQKPAHRERPAAGAGRFCNSCFQCRTRRREAMPVPALHWQRLILNPQQGKTSSPSRLSRVERRIFARLAPFLKWTIVRGDRHPGIRLDFRPHPLSKRLDSAVLFLGYSLMRTRLWPPSYINPAISAFFSVYTYIRATEEPCTESEPVPHACQQQLPVLSTSDSTERISFFISLKATSYTPE